MPLLVLVYLPPLGKAATCLLRRSRMSTRERFFPRAPKPTTNFVADSNNPLQRSASSSQGSVLADKLDSNGANQPSGLNGWRKLPSRDSASRKASLSGPVGGVRPPTADPFAQEGQFSVLAPAPKRLGQVSPPLMIGDDLSATLASEDTITTLGNHSLNPSGGFDEGIAHILMFLSSVMGLMRHP